MRISYGRDFYATCARGADLLSQEAVSGIRRAVEATQISEGLFPGRDGGGDVYYTAFALILAGITRAGINIAACRKALEAVDLDSLDFVHFFAWVYSVRLLKLGIFPGFLRKGIVRRGPLRLTAKERNRLTDFSQNSSKGFPQNNPESPYSRFLMTVLQEDFGLKFPAFDLKKYRLISGMYSNTRQGGDYGVNPTAAALLVLDGEAREEAAQALKSVQQQNGSFRAFEASPSADLLSTGTALWALKCCKTASRNTPRDFIRSCYRDSGLFAASPEDPGCDLEYTVYALLALGGSE